MSKNTPINSKHYSQFADLLDELSNMSSLHNLSSRRKNHVIKNVIIKVFGKTASKIKSWNRKLKKYILCTLKNQNNVKLHGINTACSYISSIQDKYSSNNFGNIYDDMEEGTFINKYIYNYKTTSYNNKYDANDEFDVCSSNFEPIRNLICSAENQSSSEIMIQNNYESHSHEEIMIPENMLTNFNEGVRVCQEESQTELAQIGHHIYPLDSDGGCQDSEFGNCD